MQQNKVVLVLGANSDVAKEAIRLYVEKGFSVIAASRSTDELARYVQQYIQAKEKVAVQYFDATDFNSHQSFYSNLPAKPQVVLYAAGFLKSNDEAMLDWEASFQMMKVHYCGAVSILNIIATDAGNGRLEKIIGLSSLSGVRGRKSNFIYGSTKAAFTQYLAGLRQYLMPRRIVVNVIIAGYISSKMTAGLPLPAPLLLRPSFVAKAVVQSGRRFVIVPGYKWKVIYRILTLLPERLVARLP